MRSGPIRASRPIMYFVLNSTEVSPLSLFSLFHLEGIKLRVRWHDDGDIQSTHTHTIRS